MSDTDTTNHINEEIETLNYRQAIFCLKMFLAGHRVFETTMRNIMELAKQTRCLNV
jgi:hypothetical protein